MASTNTPLPAAWLAPPPGLLSSNYRVKISPVPITISATLALLTSVAMIILFNLKEKKVYLDDKITRSTHDNEPMPSPKHSAGKPSKTHHRFFKVAHQIPFSRRKIDKSMISDPILISAPNLRTRSLDLPSPRSQPMSPHQPVEPPDQLTASQTHTPRDPPIQVSTSHGATWASDVETVDDTQRVSEHLAPPCSRISSVSTMVGEGWRKKGYGFGGVYGRESFVSMDTHDLASKTGLGDPY